MMEMRFLNPGPRLFCTIIATGLSMVALSPQSQAEIVGVSNAPQVLQTIPLALGFSIRDISPSPHAIDKLPRNSAITEVTPSFFSAWSNLAFSACQKHFHQSELPGQLHASPPEERPELIGRWLIDMTLRSWGSRANAAETSTLSAQVLEFGTGLEQIRLGFTTTCMLVLVSPHVYLKQS